MQARVDIVSQTTGRVLLSSLLDAPHDGISRLDGWEIVKILQQTKKKLEKKFGKGAVRLSLDSFEGTAFWYMVLFRAIIFDTNHRSLGSGQTWSVYELLREKENAKTLEMTDLGLVADLENMWLAVDWKEARKGIMEGFESCPTWQAILHRQQQRLDRAGIKEKVGDDYWKRCARSYSYTIPRWQLEKMNYLKKHMWHHGGGTYDDLVVLDMTGVDMPQLDTAANKAVLHTAKRVRFSHFYTEDPREYRAINKLAAEDNRKEDPKYRVKNVRRKQKQRNRRKMLEDMEEDKKSWFLASRAIAKIPRFLQSGISSGRYKKLYSGKQSDQLYRVMVDAYMNGEIVEMEINKKMLAVELDAIELHLRDPNVPEEFSKWLNWRGKLEKIREEIEAE